MLLSFSAAYLLKIGTFGGAPRLSPTGGAKASVRRAALPLGFEANRGQTDTRVKFLAHGEGYGLFLTQDGMVMELRSSAVRLKRPASAAKSTMGRPASNPTVIHMKLLGAAPNAVIAGDRELPGKANYFIGNDPAKWRTNISTYANVRYQNVYPDIDLVYYGNQGGQLEYDFVVAPGADPGAISMELESNANSGPTGSAVPLRISAEGDLILPALNGGVRLHKPLVYQEADAGPQAIVPGGAGGLLSWTARALPGMLHGRNEATPIAGSPHPSKSRTILNGGFTLEAGNRVRFTIPPYDHTRPLVIDPVLVYSTLQFGGYAIAVDSAGSAYLTGDTNFATYPITSGAFQTSTHCDTDPDPSGCFHAFITKLAPDGSTPVYSTYLGGGNYEAGLGIAVDSSGNAYLAGNTGSLDFPLVNPFQSVNKAAKAHSGEATMFLAKLNPTGSALIYSTYVGGSYQDTPGGIAIDASGNAYVTGWTFSADFPTAQPFQATCHGCVGGGADAFVTKLSATGSALVYSTFLSGSSGSTGKSIAVDASGNAYVAGGAGSVDFPTVNPMQTTGGLFISKFNPTGSALVYSTLFGGSGTDNVAGIAVDSTGSAVLAGTTYSTDFPTANALQPNLQGNGDVFVLKLNPAGSALIYSTHLGGSTNDQWMVTVGTLGGSLALDPQGNTYVAGQTDAVDFPIVNAIQPTCPACEAGSAEGFVTELNPNGSALVYSTYLGGAMGSFAQAIAVDATGNAYLTGDGASDFPGAAPLPPQPNGGAGTFVAKIASAPALGPAATLSAHYLGFPQDPVGVTGGTESILLRSVGSEALGISGISTQGDFLLVQTPTSCPYLGGSLATGSDCTIDLAFAPTATGTRTGSVAIQDNAPDTPQGASLTGLGANSAPQAIVSPPSLTFPTQWVNAPSTPQPVTLSNTGNAPLNITSIATNGMFTETNNCGSSLAAHSACTINVSFAPIPGAAPTARYLYITDNSNGVQNSTQAVNLIGAYQDFGFWLLPNASTTLPAGSTGTYLFAVGGEGAGFDQTVNFTCSLVDQKGVAPSDATCSVAPQSLVPPKIPTQITVTVVRSAASEGVWRMSPPPRFPMYQLIMLAGLLLAALVWSLRTSPAAVAWRPAKTVILAAALLLVVGLGACTGSGSRSDPPSDPLPSSPIPTYSLYLTGTARSGSNTLTNTTNIELYLP
jgi:hypothetical protein